MNWKIVGSKPGCNEMESGESGGNSLLAAWNLRVPRIALHPGLAVV